MTALTDAVAGFKAVQDAMIAEGWKMLNDAKAAVDAIVAANDSGDQAAIAAAADAMKAGIDDAVASLTEIEANQTALIDAAKANTPVA